MNIFDYEIPRDGELHDTLLSHRHATINRIISAADFRSDLYVQEEDEWLVLLEGEAKLLLGEKEITLKKGETLFIPARQPHCVLHTTEGALWLTVYLH